MKKLKLYLETTLFNYYFDTNRDGHRDTVALFEAIGKGAFDGYTSEYVRLELLNAPEPKQQQMLSLINKYNIEVLPTNDDAVKLAERYISFSIIPARFIMDGVHIAIATINKLDCILSFNFSHINKLKTKYLTEPINISEGYNRIAICTPMEILDYE